MNPHQISESLNGVNLIVSMGLLALGIVLIVYGFRLPGTNCNDNSNKKCINVQQLNNPKDKTDDVLTLRLVAIITGFLLIIPLGLNVAEMVFDHIPGGDNFGSLASSLGGAINQKSYSGPGRGGRYNMKSKHGMHHDMNYHMKY